MPGTRLLIIADPKMLPALASGLREGGKFDVLTIPITEVQGIDIAEHPWEKMMEGKKPAPEPLAKLVPFDNYYVTFKSVRKFIEFGELLDQWGTNLIRAYELHSRDYRLKERYEKQGQELIAAERTEAEVTA